MSPASDWNPRYVLYAASLGEAPEQTRERDAERWPGGRNTGFMLWISARWQEWCKLRGYRRTASGSNNTTLTDVDHAEFDAWLGTRDTSNDRKELYR